MLIYQHQGEDDVLGRNMLSLQIHICCVDGNKIQH
jgi:hypothetical protein